MDRFGLSEGGSMIDLEKQEADPVCEICGSSEGIAKLWVDGESVIRCDRHAVGVSQAAEKEYWRRRSSLDCESE